MTINGSGPAGIDPRLYAYLRVLYASSESDLTAHGYDPFTLQASGSFVSLDIEVSVVKTIVGILAVILRSLGTDLAQDVYCIKNELYDEQADSRGGGSGNILEDISRVMRQALRLPPILSTSPSVRKLQEAVALSMAQSSRRNLDVKIYEDNAPFTSVNATLERSLEDIIRSQMAGPGKEMPGSRPEPPRPTVREEFIVIPSVSAESLAEELSLDGLGDGLPVNLRESLKYRIRKKKLLSDLIFSMGELHKVRP